ncbi:MAG: asparagine synthase [Thaumarchaeota archaeon]|nr:asparagine synthase [Nitrososphaerota archaeon]
MTPYPGSFEDAAKDLATAVSESVGRCVAGQKRVAVSFSGGLDSSIVAACAKRRAEVFLCSAFAEGSHDEWSSLLASEALGLPLRSRTVTRGEAAREIEEMDLPYEPSPMDRSLWCIYSISGQEAREGGAKVILLGQMADELFGGYAKYKRALEESGETYATQMMSSDAEEYIERGMLRDTSACSRWVEPKFPYTDGSVAGLGESFPVSYKIRYGVRKAVLREAAMILGVPDGLASQAKKAAQYSSGVEKLLR